MRGILSIAAMMLITATTWSQALVGRIAVRIPDIEQEATSVWRTIKDISFFEKMGYQVNLPPSELIDSLIKKSKTGAFGSDDYSSIYSLLETRIYNSKDYSAALTKVQEQVQLLNSLILQLDTLRKSWDWDFKMFDNYSVVITLYGSGGSYDDATGTVTLFASTDGGFKMYKNPANTIIHEIVHMGIEESIITHYNVPHVLKERIVDKIVFLLFSEFLPEYQIQNMGSSCIDGYLKEKSDIRKLGKLVENCTK